MRNKYGNLFIECARDGENVVLINDSDKILKRYFLSQEYKHVLVKFNSQIFECVAQYLQNGSGILYFGWYEFCSDETLNTYQQLSIGYNNISDTFTITYLEL